MRQTILPSAPPQTAPSFAFLCRFAAFLARLCDPHSCLPSDAYLCPLSAIWQALKSAERFLQALEQQMPRGAASSQHQRQQRAIDVRSLRAALSAAPQLATRFFQYLVLQSQPARSVSGNSVRRADTRFSMRLKCRDSFSLTVDVRSGMRLHCVFARVCSYGTHSRKICVSHVLMSENVIDTL